MTRISLGTKSSLGILILIIEKANSLGLNYQNGNQSSSPPDNETKMVLHCVEPISAPHSPSGAVFNISLIEFICLFSQPSCKTGNRWQSLSLRLRLFPYCDSYWQWMRLRNKLLDVSICSLQRRNLFSRLANIQQTQRITFERILAGNWLRYEAILS